MGPGAQTLLVVLVAGALSWGVTHVPQRDWVPPPEVPITLGGEHYRVGPSELEWLEAYSERHFSEGAQAARESVAAEIDAQLDRMFSKARQQLPGFADWYYSLQGEYSRMAMAALSAVNLAEPGYVAARATEMLFPSESWTADLGELERRADARLRQRESQDRAAWFTEVTRRLSAHRVPLALPGSRAAAELPIELDGLVAQMVAREQATLETRMSLSTLAAGGAAVGPALWRGVAARRSAAAAGRAAAERLAVRGAARVGTAAAGGAAVCSPGGPAALGCALLAGTAAWLGTDWVLLSIDEHLHRDDLLEALEAGLAELRDGMREELLATYDALIDGHYDSVQDDIQRSFVPARASGTQTDEAPSRASSNEGGEAP